MARVDTLKNFLTDIADKFREKLGTTGTISHADYDTKIEEVYDKGEADGREALRSEIIDTTRTDWNYFAYKMPGLAQLLNYSDTSNGTSFNSMFLGCETLKSVPAFDTSKGTDLQRMFQDCKELQSVHEINTDNATNLFGLFMWCAKLRGDIKLTNTSKVTDFRDTFYYVPYMTSQELDMSSANTVFSMFYYCYALKSVKLYNIGRLNTLNISTMVDMFTNCTSLTSLTITGTITVNANATQIFKNCTSLSSASLESFLNALSDNTNLSTTYTVTLGSANLARLSQDQKNIAINKNIKLA